MIRVLCAMGMLLLCLSGAGHGADQVYEAIETGTPPVLDGILDEPVWSYAETDTLAFRWDGTVSESPTAEDLSVTFQAVWSDSTNRLYVAVRVRDDVIADHFDDPVASYWAEDGVEVFLDPDRSGGDHQYSYSAFAYHVSLFGDALDLGSDRKAVNLKDHVRLGLSEDRKTWEIAFVLYEVYSHDGNSENDAVRNIEAGDEIGFSIAYNDNDGALRVRESMVGWVPDGGDSWINADRFGTLRFVAAPATEVIRGSWGRIKNTRKFTTEPAQRYPMYEVDPIVVTASRIPSIFSHIARSVLVITHDEIERSPAQSVQDLLKYASGVDLRQRGPHGIQADVSLRGGTYEQTLILIDGIKMNDPQTGHHNLDIPLQLDEVERIEILKGHGSRLYGPNALGGVINVITKRGEEKKIRLSGVAGDYGLFDAGLLLSYPFGSSRHHLSISGKRSNGYRHNTDFKSYNAFYRLTSGPRSREANISMGYMDKEFGANSFYSSLYPDQWEHTKTGFVHAAATLENSRIVFSPGVYWRSHEDDFTLDRENPEWYRNRHEKEGYGFEFQSTFASQWGISAFGGEVGKERIESSNLGTHSRARGGLFVEHQFEFVKSLSCMLGSTAYYYSDWGWDVWPGIDLGFWFTESLSIHSSVGRSFRVPTYTELYYDSPANKGNPDITPEEAWTYEVGLKWGKKRLRGEFILFRREGDNLIDWVRADPDSSWMVRNIARVNTNGVEVNFGFNSVNLKYFPVQKIQLGYTFLDSDREIKGLESKYVLDHLRHQFIFDMGHHLVFQLRQNWKLRFEERIGGERYLLCDTRISRKFKNGELFVDVTNVFSTDYTEVGGISMPGRWAVVGLKFSLIPDI